jgi:hypothetical protein
MPYGRTEKHRTPVQKEEKETGVIKEVAKKEEQL